MEIVRSSETIFITDIEQGVTYYVPATTSLRHTATKTLTKYPTTEGTSMTDHAYKDPDDLTLSISVGSIKLSGVDNCYYFSDGTAASKVTLTLDDTKQLLQRWYDNNTRLTIQSRNALFTNMVLYSISVTDNDNNLAVYSPSLSFQEARVAVIETAVLGPFKTTQTQASDVDEKSAGSNEGTTFAEVAGGIAGGAASGALIGNLIPLPGARIAGAIIGGIAGLIGSVT